MNRFKTLSRTRVLDRGMYLVVEDHTVEAPDGSVIERWPWVISPDYVTMVAVTTDDRVLCFRQTKYAIDGVSLALPGGYIEPGEDPLAAAMRELREETGCEASDWTPLGRYPIDSNRGVGVAHFFLARGAVQVASPDADDLEPQERVLLPIPEVESAVRNADFNMLPWAACAAIALTHLSSRS